MGQNFDPNILLIELEPEFDLTVYLAFGSCVILQYNMN